MTIRRQLLADVLAAIGDQPGPWAVVPNRAFTGLTLRHMTTQAAMGTYTVWQAPAAVDRATALNRA